MIELLSWLLLGLIAGAVARLLHPGRDSMGWFTTIALGVLGSFLGGGLTYAFRLGRAPYEPAGYILSIVGAVVLLMLGVFTTRRAKPASRAS